MSTRSDILTLHTAAAVGAANGTPAPIGEEAGLILWFVPASAYDGVVTFEFSPDNETTWYPARGYPLGTGVGVLSITSPLVTSIFYIPLPSTTSFRARLSGGTVGTVTVKARRTRQISGIFT